MLNCCCFDVSKCKDGLILMITPLLLSPLLIVNYDSTEARCAFVVLLMIVYWIFQPIPLAVTALIPVALFPLLGLATTEKACEPYLKSTNMLFMASLIIAIAMENSGFHKRMAYRILILIGPDLRILFAGFMFVTMFLGIWIINTAATAMILPIADVVVEELFNKNTNRYNNNNNNNDYQLNGVSTDSMELAIKQQHQKPEIVCNVLVLLQNWVIPNFILGSQIQITKKQKKLAAKLEYIRRLLYICVAYSATIGGTTTLTSNGPNLVFQFVIDEFYGGVSDVDYAKWLLFCLPSTILSVFACWIFITMFYLKRDLIRPLKKSTKSTLIRKLNELGTITFHECAVVATFIILIFLWMFRDPQFLPGWARLLNHKIIPKDTTPAILMVILLFCIPSHPFGPYPSKSLLDWTFAQNKIPWGVILLRGGGFAMADTALSSGLTNMIGKQMIKINQLPIWSMVMIFSLLASFTTELASNSAIASIFLPISGQIAMFLDKNPLLFIIPITLSCSFAFVLPVGTPANALVSSHAKLSPFDMVVPGTVTKILCIIIMFLNLYATGFWMFSLDQVPSWTNSSAIHELNKT